MAFGGECTIFFCGIQHITLLLLPFRACFVSSCPSDCNGYEYCNFILPHSEESSGLSLWLMAVLIKISHKYGFCDNAAWIFISQNLKCQKWSILMTALLVHDSAVMCQWMCYCFRDGFTERWMNRQNARHRFEWRFNHNSLDYKPNYKLVSSCTV